MSVYVVVGGRNSERLEARMEERFAGEHFRLFGNNWFVNAALTTAEVSGALNLPDGKAEATAIVFPVSNYAGWAPKSAWEWLRSREAFAMNG